MKNSLKVLLLFSAFILFIVQSSIADAGQILWTTDGVAVSTVAGNQQTPFLASDGSKGTIIVWEDLRDGNYDVYAQRISYDGIVLWTTGGKAVCNNSSDQLGACLASNKQGGAIIAWHDTRRGYGDIYAQNLNSSGNAIWPTEFVTVCADANNQVNPAIAGDGQGGAIIAWRDYRNDANGDLYAQRINANGTSLWGANGIPVCTAASGQDGYKILSDGQGGAIITWGDSRTGTSAIYAQKIDPDGTIAAAWPSNGVTVCSVAGGQFGPVLASGEAGSVIIAWQDNRNGNPDIYVQKINANGSGAWATNGIPICSLGYNQYSPRIISDGNNGAIISWLDYRNGSNYNVYAQRVTTTGSPQWAANGTNVCAAANDKSYQEIASDGNGGAIITWMDNRSSPDLNIYAQRLDLNGIVWWATDGITVCAAADNQYYPQIMNNGIGEAIITWMDKRNGNYDIYAQRISTEAAGPLSTVYVSTSGFNTSEGTSASKAFRTIGYALTRVATGGTVNVLAGTYNEHDIIWPVRDYIKLVGAGPDLTVISCEALGRGIIFNNSVSAIVRELKIRDGRAPAAAANQIGNFGGGICYLNDTNIGAVLIVNDCIFQNNEASNGGVSSAQFISGGSGGGIFSACRANAISSCVFMNNRSGNGSGSAGNGGNGGGLSVVYPSSIIGCVFSDNRTGNGGGAGYGGNGAGAYSEFSSTFLNCSFIGNITGFGVSGGSGGGAASHDPCSFTGCVFSSNETSSGIEPSGNGGGAYSASSGTFTGCKFLNNRTQGSPVGGNGGGACTTGPALLTNCVFSGNRTGNGSNYSNGSYATGNGGGVWADSVSVYNCTFYGNLAGVGPVNGYGGAIYMNNKDNNKIINSIFYANGAVTGNLSMYLPGGGNSKIAYCDVQHGSGYNSAGFYSETCIDKDPLFASTDQSLPDAFLKLSPVSPCINAGTFEGAPASDILGNSRQEDLRPDMGAYEFMVAGATAKPSAVVPSRPRNIPNPFKTGTGTTIIYTLTSDSNVKLIIYDIAGKSVATKFFSGGGNGARSGENRVFWDGYTDFGKPAPNGVYIYVITSGTKVLAKGQMAIMD